MVAVKDTYALNSVSDLCNKGQYRDEACAGRHKLNQ